MALCPIPASPRGWTTLDQARMRTDLSPVAAKVVVTAG